VRWRPAARAVPERADLAVRGGRVYTPDGFRVADVLVAGGRVLEVEAHAGPAAEEVDASGLLVLPGAVDAHVHSRDPGFPEKEDFGSLTAAAAAGGVTTVVDMPNTVPAVDGPDVFAEKAAAASDKARVDFALWAAIRSTTEPADIAGLVEAGAVGFKAYLGYAFRLRARQIVYSAEEASADLEAPPDYGTLAVLASEMARHRVPLAAHAEDPAVLRRFARPLRTYADLLAARPALAEAIAVAAVGALSRQAGLHVHVVHLASRAGLEAALEARRGGACLTLETCPHYLWLTDADHERLGTSMKVYPAVRGADDRAALLDALRRGDVEIVATDHAPHSDAEKLTRSLDEALPGSPGVETLYLSCLDLARHWGDPGSAVRWASEGPARMLGIYPRKGALQPGSDADLVLADPRGETVVSAERLHSRQRHSALEGQRLGFALRAVYSRGELVSEGGEPVGEGGRGRLVRPAIET
jgi:dihydroorotase (multifunctional complex type)